MIRPLADIEAEIAAQHELDASIKAARAGACPWMPAACAETHLANAHRVRFHFGDQMLFVEGTGWHTRATDGPWRHDEIGAARIVQGLGQLIATEAAGLGIEAAGAPNATAREALAKKAKDRFVWAKSTESQANMEATLATAEPLLHCAAADMDSDHDLLGMPGGVLDLRTIAVRPYTARDRITKTTACAFDPEAKAPRWRQFLRETFADEALIEYVQRLLGYALCGRRTEHILPIFFGTGANGKSALLGAVQHALGSYAGTAPADLLMQHRGEQHPTALAGLQGLRLVICSESADSARLNEGLVKSLTGGDRIAARRMRQDFFEFSPTHLLILQTNHRPRVGGTDRGIWRRLKLVPFDRVVDAAEQDPDLPAKLRAEAPGILGWLVEGLAKYRSDGLHDSRAVVEASATYRADSDALGAFIADRCRTDPHRTTTCQDLYRVYADWCSTAGEHPKSQRNFGVALAERGFKQARTNRARRWVGIVASDASDASDVDLAMTRGTNSSLGAIPEFASPRVTASPSQQTEPDLIERDGAW